MNLEQKARAFATKAHEGQVRKDGVTPYITHPEAVVALLRDEVGVDDQEVLAAAWLHDVVEDCDYGLDDIRNEFGPRVAAYVGGLTKFRPKEDYLDSFRTLSYEVKLIKLADVVHNSSCMHGGIPEETIRNKVSECDFVFYELAQEVHPPFYDVLVRNVEPWRCLTRV